jgi:L-amino acid N-acyltransferase YncA
MKSTRTATNMHEVNIRIAESKDLPAIVAIYNQAIPSHRSTANTTPHTVESHEAWFLQHEPDKHPIFVAEAAGRIIGWCSLSAYRPGRSALRFTAEISYYVEKGYRHQGVGSGLLGLALNACSSLGIKTLIAVLIDRNEASKKLLEKLGFQQWGYLPGVLDFNGQEYGEYYYGKRVSE